MNRVRKLALRREVLVELADDELSRLAGGTTTVVGVEGPTTDTKCGICPIQTILRKLTETIPTA